MATLETARISVEDVGASLRDYAGGIEASPEHLAEVEDRLAAIDRLKRKYGPTLEDVIKHGTEVSRKLSEMENKDEVLRQLRAGLAQAAEEYLGAARTISKKRYESARKLEKVVEAEINDHTSVVVKSPPRRSGSHPVRSSLSGFRPNLSRKFWNAVPLHIPNSDNSRATSARHWPGFIWWPFRFRVQINFAKVQPGFWKSTRTGLGESHAKYHAFRSCSGYITDIHKRIGIV